MSDEVSILPVAGASSKADTRHITSTASASAAHPSSHQKRVIYQRYISLKIVHAIATPWSTDAMTGEPREDKRPELRQSLSPRARKTSPNAQEHHSLFRAGDQGSRFMGGRSESAGPRCRRTGTGLNTCPGTLPALFVRFSQQITTSVGNWR